MSATLRRNVLREARAVRARIAWDPEQMEQFRLSRARHILLQAATCVPYYRERFQQWRFNPRKFTSFDDLRALPCLTRDDLRDFGETLRDEQRDPGTLVRMSTGGTTGTPVSVYLDPRAGVERMLVNHRMYSMMGRRLGDSTLLIAGSPIDVQAWSTFRERVKSRLFGVTVRSSFKLTPDCIQRTLRDISVGRFQWVIAYASVFDILAAGVTEAYRKPSRLRIISCAELVTEAQRERWRECLGAEVFEIYGAREMSSIAGEVRDHEALVVNADLYHIEITDTDGRVLPQGVPGLITITTLHESAMPLIRYQLGDVGMLVPTTGVDMYPVPRLKITHGRILDVICCPDGKLLPGEFFPHLMKEVQREVRQFQVVQTALNRLEVRIMPHGSFRDDTRQYLEAHIHEQTGHQMEVQVVLVDGIEHSASGKYRPTISVVPLEAKQFSQSVGASASSAR